MRHLIIAVLCLGFLGMGGYLCLGGVQNIQTARESNNWHKTNAEIIRSEIVEFTDDEGEIGYEPVIEYEYSVNDAKYKGSTIYIGQGFSGISYAENLVSKYPLKKQIQIYYKPDAPSVSVVEPGLMKDTFLEFTLGVGLAFIGLWIGVVGFLLWLVRPGVMKFTLGIGLVFIVLWIGVVGFLLW